MVFPIGAPNDAFARYFIGQSYLAPLSTAQVGIYNVTFEPGCRNNWHIHHAKCGGGQILVCVAGCGFYQEEGKTAQELHPGAETANEWLEAVSDGEYFKATGKLG